MAKKSKLLEKGTRMPDIRERGLDQTVREYLAAVQSLSSEAARAHHFTLLLQELFGLEPRFIEEYVAGPRGGRRGWNGNSPPASGALAQLQLARTLRGRAQVALPRTGGPQDPPRSGRVLHPRLAGCPHGQQIAGRTATRGGLRTPVNEALLPPGDHLTRSSGVPFAPVDYVVPRFGHGLAVRTHRVRPSEKTALSAIPGPSSARPSGLGLPPPRRGGLCTPVMKA